MEFIENSAFARGDQELLLRAALLKGAAAVDAWKEWTGLVDLEGRLDNGTFDLLPLLYTNLQRLEIEYPHMNLLRGIYRQAWYRNQRFFLDASRIMDSLHNAGMHTMALKGLPLTVLHYKNFGVRPTDDMAILVPSSQALPAADALTRAGWNAVTTSEEGPLQHQCSRRFMNESGMELELHWHLICRSCRLDSDSDFWKKAVPVTIHGVPTCALSPTDMLFHVFADGRRREPGPSFQWIADAMTIIHSSHCEIDWPRIINYAKKYKIILQIKESLHYLCDKFEAEVPKTITESMKHIPVSSLEWSEYRRVISSGETNRESLLGGLPLYLIEYLRLTRDSGLLQKIAGFPKYLQDRLNEKNFLHLVFSLTIRIMRTMKRKLSEARRKKSVKPGGMASRRGNFYR